MERRVIDMTLDEAIAMMHEWADYECYNEEQIQASEAFNQIAVLLEELKSYRAHIFSGDMTQAMLKEQYCKAIDDFLEKIQWEYLDGCGIEQKEIEFLIAVSSQVAEQLKAGVNNES